MARPQLASESEILDAAGLVLDRDAVDGFTLAAVAREVGLTRAGLAFRFDNARRLKLAVLDARATQFDAMMDGLELQRGGNGLLALARFIGTIAHSPRNLISAMTKSQQGFFDEDLLAIERRRAASLRAAIDRAMPLHVADRAGALDMFAAHLSGSLINWASSGEADGGTFLARRTMVWLEMTQIAFDTAQAEAA